jgi:hypothetical protein
MTTKLERLLRHHRQHGFGPNGDAHQRANLCLKNTVTFRRMCDANQVAAEYRVGQRIFYTYA